MKTKAFILAECFFCCLSYGQAILPDYSTVGRELPAGVPRIEDAHSNVVYINYIFTSAAYQEYACSLLLKEANTVAQELQLPETLPITKSNLVGGYVSPFGFAYAFKMAGNISTTNYSYGVEEADKFSDLFITKIDDRCRDYMEKYQWPINRLDTNAAYHLATQWLAAVHMDVNALNRDFDVRIDVDPSWNDVSMGQLPAQKFTPIYIVSWLMKDKPLYSAGGGAYVELFLPTKTLLTLKVDDAKYILRQPLVFTNLAALFPGKAAITVVTNWPTK